jgi:phage-related minor tail protein
VIDWDTYARAVMDAQDRLMPMGEVVKEVAEESKAELSELQKAVEGWGKSSADAIVEFAMTGKSSFKDMINSMLADLARMLVYRNITAPLASAVGGMDWGSIGASVAGFFGFAQGGVMTSAGPLPLRAYSAGGVANSPQLALYGEGSRPEAYVPLPDGRSIPVTMTGGGGPRVSVVVHNTAGDVARASGTATTDAAGNTQIMVMVEKIEGMMGRRIGQGSGLAPMLEGRYGLNPAAGARR